MDCISFSDQISELYEWISEVRCNILSGNYTDRGKMQRKLMKLEGAKYRLEKIYQSARS